MVRLAITDHPAFELDDAEVRATSPSYTVPTLLRLRETLGLERPLVLLLGADAFLGLTSWHCWQDLFDLAHLAVATRPGSVLDETTMPTALAQAYATRHCDRASQIRQAPAGLILPFSITSLDISATRLRTDFATGRSPRYLLPDPVLGYIFRHGLYSSSLSPSS